MSHTIGQAKQDTEQSNSNSNESPQDTSTPEAVSPAGTSGLSDGDYEFLFNQLLEGIAHGWHDQRIIKFFKQLGDRGKQSDWVSWLNRLRSKLLKLPMQSKQPLGTMMIRLGELTQSTTEVNQIGAASHSIGKELLFGNTPAVIWEYTGPDLSSKSEVLETEQEFSARLPDDFSDLGDDILEGLELAGTADSASSLQKSTNDNELQDNPWFDDEPEPKDGIDLSIAAHQEIAPEHKIADTASTVSEIASGDEELNLNLEPEAKTEIAESLTDVDLDLDLEPASSPQVTSYGEEFEFELAAESIPEEATSDNQSPSLEEESLGSAADLLPEEPISAPNELSNALQAFELDPESESTFLEESEAENPDFSGMEIPELTPSAVAEALEQQRAAEQDALTTEQQSEMILAHGLENQPSPPELEDSSLELIESWFNLGLKQVSAGEYTKAIASWDKALAINANLAEAWHNRGSALGRLGNYEAAIESFQNALEIDPVNYQAWNDRAHALYQLENWPGAIESWSQAIAIMPGNHLFWYNRGCALEQLAKWQDAIASYEKALEIKPDFQPGRSRYINLVADNSRPN